MRRRHRGVYLLAASVSLGVASAAAQIPSPPKNLTVLPKDIPQRELIETMKGFTSALDVRCNHCHVHSGSDPDDLATFDFASDEKVAKRTARAMIQMVQAINEEHLPRIGKERSQLVRVGCVTCHHGLAKPGTLEDALGTALAEGGVEAAKRRYQELRAQYFGRSAYDFGPESLVRLARRLAREQKLAEAIGLLALNLELHPQSATTLLALGEAQLVKGDRAGAAASFVRLLEIEPENAWARKRLAEVAPAHSAALGEPILFTVFDQNHSTIAFTVGISGGLSAVTGKFTSFAVTLAYDEGDVTKSSVTAVIQAATLTTGIPERDTHLRTADFFDVERHPEIRFTSERVERRQGGLVAIGRLEMRGVAKQVELPFEVTGLHTDGESGRVQIGLAAATTLRRGDYGLVWQHPAVPDFVAADVGIEIHLISKLTQRPARLRSSRLVPVAATPVPGARS